jgi:hypothetical protein
VTIAVIGVTEFYSLRLFNAEGNRHYQ